MWKHRHFFFVAGGLIMAMMVCVQLIYPYDTALPFAVGLNTSMSGASLNDVSARFQKTFEASTVQFTSGDKKVVQSLASMGIAVNSEPMARKLTEYPLWQRLIPGSLFIPRRVTSFELELTGAKLEDRVAAIASELSFDPVDATLAFEEGKINVGTAKSGRRVVANDVRNALLKTSFRGGMTTVTVDGAVLTPARSDGDVANAKALAERVVAKKITVNIAGRRTIVMDPKTVISWLTLEATGNTLALSINHAALSATIAGVQQETKTESQPSVVTMTDGVEQSRTTGGPGQQLSLNETTSSLAAHLLDSGAVLEVDAPLETIPPTTVVNRSYTHSERGLSAYVDYATSTRNVRIVVQQLDGPGWKASGRANESIPSASTYKLFVMLRVFDDIMSGGLTWDTPMLDTTAGGCFERTIVPSTNPCAEEWIRQYGRQTLNNYIHAKGFSDGTTFTASNATHTTAGDLARYLIGLNDGSLVSGNNRAMLLEKMGRQLYRYGIPTGTKGWTQDKVGFLWDYIHDAAIVHNPQGTYIMVIMTKGYSYGYIANVARQIDTILYP